MNKKNVFISFVIIGLVLTGLIIRSQYSMSNSNRLSSNFLLQYKSSYMGDASNTTQLFNELKLREYSRSYQLYPDDLTVEIKFKEDVHVVDKEQFQRAIVYNSIVAFSLLDNLQGIHYNSSDTIFIVTRDSAKSWFDHDKLFVENNLNPKFLKIIENKEFIEKCLVDIKSL